MSYLPPVTWRFAAPRYLQAQAARGGAWLFALPVSCLMTRSVSDGTVGHRYPTYVTSALRDQTAARVSRAYDGVPNPSGRPRLRMRRVRWRTASPPVPRQPRDSSSVVRRRVVRLEVFQERESMIDRQGSWVCRRSGSLRVRHFRSLVGSFSTPIPQHLEHLVGIDVVGHYAWLPYHAAGQPALRRRDLRRSSHYDSARAITHWSNFRMRSSQASTRDPGVSSSDR